MARVQRHHHTSRRRHRQVHFEVLVAVQGQNGHALTRLHTELGEGPGQAAAARPGLGVGQTHVATDHRHTVGKQLVSTAERIDKSVHGTSSRLQQSTRVPMILVWFETDNTLPIVKTDYKSFKQRDTPNNVKAYSKAVREPNTAGETIALELHIHVVQVDRSNDSTD